MQRYDVFESVHKGLKALLYDTALLLQHADFSKEEPFEAVTEAIKEAVHLLEEHIQTEAKFIVPLILDFEPGIADQFIKDQQQALNLSAQLKNALSNFVSEQTLKSDNHAGKVLSCRYMEFMLFQINLMVKEEELLNKILWKYFSDKHIAQLQKEMLQNNCLTLSEKLTRWMMRGINDTEAVYWLKTVERTASQLEFKTLFATAEKELSQDRFKKLLSSLTEGVMLA